MALRKGSVDVVFPVGDSDWTIQGVKWALLCLAQQTFTKWRLVVVDATRSPEVKALVEAIIPAEKVEYAVTALKPTATLSDLLYEGVCGVKAKYVAYLLPTVCWYPDHIEKLVEQMNDGADVVFMNRRPGQRGRPDQLSVRPGCVKIWGVMHRLAHYERTYGFPRKFEGDVGLALMQAFDELRETAWEPLVAHIPAPAAPALPPETLESPTKVTQLSLFQHA